MVSRLSLLTRKLRKHSLVPSLQELEPRRLLSSFNLYGTSGDDHIVVSFDPLAGNATVTGASNVPDGTVFPAGTPESRLGFHIDVGDGNDYVEIGLEPPGKHGFYDASRATILGGAGDDELIGGNGSVTLNGGAGNDKLVARSTEDQWANVVEFTGALKGVNVNLSDGIVYDDGEGGVDQVSGVG